MITAIKELLLTPIDDWKKKVVIVLVAALFVLLPQHYPTDWDLNTGFWADLYNPYRNPDTVYPPWGIILMLPYKLMEAAGARFLSVLVVGWLAVRRRWPLSMFFAIVLSPYFIFTMQKSNMDIFVYALPILLWEATAATRWRNVGWGAALSLLLLKPQGAMFILPYLLFTSGGMRKVILPLLLVALVTVPVSLVGSPPLIIQWLKNVTHPSGNNAVYWSSNNISLSSNFPVPAAFLMVGAVGAVCWFLARRKRVAWTPDHTCCSLLLASMLMSPYASQQGVSAALAFTPSWPATLLSIVGLIAGAGQPWYFDVLPLWVLSLGFASLLLHRRSPAPARDPAVQDLAK